MSPIATLEKHTAQQTLFLQDVGSVLLAPAYKDGSSLHLGKHVPKKKVQRTPNVVLIRQVHLQLLRHHPHHRLFGAAERDTDTDIDICIYIYIHLCIHIYTQTHTHTYIHICVYMISGLPNFKQKCAGGIELQRQDIKKPATSRVSTCNATTTFDTSVLRNSGTSTLGSSRVHV